VSPFYPQDLNFIMDMYTSRLGQMFIAVSILLVVAIVILMAIATAKTIRRTSKRSSCCCSSSGDDPCGTLDGDAWWGVDCLDFEVGTGMIAEAVIATDPVMNPPDENAGIQQSIAQLPAAVVSGLKTVCTTVPEAEEMVAANPASSAGLQWIAAVSDFSLRGGFNTTKYSYSLDGGNNWSQHFVPLNAGNQKPTTSDSIVWDVNSDPVCGFSPSGNIAYNLNIYFNVSNNANGLYLAAAPLPSVFGPALYTASQVRPVVVNTSPSTTNFEDKPWMAVDPTSGAVYVSWTRFTNVDDKIMFTKSTNGGTSWSTPIQVSPSSFNGGVQGSAVAADGQGNVWVCWTTFFTGGLRRIFASKSTNGGASFSMVGIAVSPFFNSLTFPSAYRKEAFPAMAIERVSKTVHIVYPATANNGTSKILYQRALNGSTTFSAPINLVNVSFGNQFFPAIATDFKTPGLVQVSWFDTRNCTVTNNRQIDVYTSRSTNSGLTFNSSNQRVTPVKTDVGTATFVGDYCGVAAQNLKALPVFAFLVTPLQTAIVSS
jgi:hypothetical protein